MVVDEHFLLEAAIAVFLGEIRLDAKNQVRTRLSVPEDINSEAGDDEFFTHSQDLFD